MGPTDRTGALVVLLLASLLLSSPGLATTPRTAGDPAPAATSPALTTSAVDTSATAMDLALAMATESWYIEDAAFAHLPPTGTPYGIGSAGHANGFPSRGDTFAILTTGNAAWALGPDNATDTGVRLGGPAIRDFEDRDVTVLRVDVTVPPAWTKACFRMDVRFLTDEWSQSYNTAYVDGFIAELDALTWTLDNEEGSGSPYPRSSDNGNREFHYDEFSGYPLTTQAVIYGGHSGRDPIPEDAPQSPPFGPEVVHGTTYDGATIMLTATNAGLDGLGAGPGTHSIYLSIFDTGDDRIDSAVFIDNLRVGPSSAGCEPVNVPPTTSFTYAPCCPMTGEPVQFTSTFSDVDGDVVAWTWDFGGVGSSTEADPSFSFPAPGTYGTCLTVTDDEGGEGTTCQDVEVINAPPEAQIDAPPQYNIHRAVTFDGGVSSDPEDGSVTHYRWYDGGELVGTEPTLRKTYVVFGTHCVTLEVEDSGGLTDTATGCVEVVGDLIVDVQPRRDPFRATDDVLLDVSAAWVSGEPLAFRPFTLNVQYTTGGPVLDQVLASTGCGTLTLSSRTGSTGSRTVRVDDAFLAECVGPLPASIGEVPTLLPGSRYHATVDARAGLNTGSDATSYAIVV